MKLSKCPSRHGALKMYLTALTTRFQNDRHGLRNVIVHSFAPSSPTSRRNAIECEILEQAQSKCSVLVAFFIFVSPAGQTNLA